MQHTHDTFSAAKQTKEIILLCDHITGPANQGALFRLADAFGIQEIVFVGNTPDMSSSRLKKTARSTQEYVSHSTTTDGLKTLQTYKDKGYHSIALEITADSTSISELATTSDKLLLLIGNEQTGVSQELLELVDLTTHIKMYGHNSSMNVAQATAVALYQLSQ